MFSDCVFFDDFKFHLLIHLEVISKILKFAPNMSNFNNINCSEELEQAFYSVCSDEIDCLINSIQNFVPKIEKSKLGN